MLLYIGFVSVFILLIIIIILGRLKIKNLKKILENCNAEIARIRTNDSILYDWLKIKQYGGTLEQYLKDNRIFNIAIYGCGVLGKVLYNELKDTDIHVECFIDKKYENRLKRIHTFFKKYENYSFDVPVIGLDSIPEIDVIIVSVINYYDDIVEDLLKHGQNTIISLEDIIYGIGVPVKHE